MHNVFAIDPGKKGAICALVYDNALQKYVPEFMDISSDWLGTVEWLIDMKLEHNINHSIIEDVHSIFGTSAKSNFEFGRSVGSAEIALISLGLSLDRVNPKVWQKYLGAKVSSTLKGTPRSKALKKAVAIKCGELYPKCDVYGPKGGVMDGRSDALGIAHYLIHKINKGV